MANRTHHATTDTRVMPNRDLASANSHEPEHDAWLVSAVRATTVGELYELWQRAVDAGVETETLRSVCAAVKDRLGPDGHWAAIALVKRELGGELVAP